MEVSFLPIRYPKYCIPGSLQDACIENFHIKLALFELKPVFLKDNRVFICSLHVTDNPPGTQVLSHITWLWSLKATQQIFSLKWLCDPLLASHPYLFCWANLPTFITYHISPPKQIKIPFNIFKHASRLSLPSLLPQSLASKMNVILLTVPQRRVLLMLYTKIIQPFFFCLIFPCSYLQGSHLLLYLQHHTEFAFSGLCTIPPQSLTPPLFGRRHLPFVYVWHVFFLAGHMTLPLTLLLKKLFLPTSQSQAAQLTHYQQELLFCPLWGHGHFLPSGIIYFLSHLW